MLAPLRLIALLPVWTVLALLHLAGSLLPAGVSRRVQASVRKAWGRLTCLILGVSVEVRGTPPANGPFLVASNHLGYLDIPVITSVVPGTFVAKSEVREWPVLGLLARLSGTIFVRRESTASSLSMVDGIAAALSAGGQVVVFPEGTSSHGEKILPFKSTAFAAVTEPRGVGDALILPVSIDVVRVDGLPAYGPVRDIFCWHGTAEFLPHFLRLMSTASTTVRLSIGEPIDATGLSRDEAARSARERVVTLFATGHRAIEYRPGDWIFVHPVV